MPDRLKPTSPAFAASQSRWHHNAFLGHAKMMLANCNTIIQSPTTTEHAKHCAKQIAGLTVELTEALRTRRDGK